jgi:hypothetical protein
MNKWCSYIALFLAGVCFFSCKDMPAQHHGPIVLGDSSTIVTEKDPQKLQDLVTDLQPTITEPKDTTPPAPEKAPETKVPDTTKKTVVAETPKQQPVQ